MKQTIVKDIQFTLKDTSTSLRLFDSCTLRGSEFRQAFDTITKVEEMHNSLTEKTERIRGVIE